MSLYVGEGLIPGGRAYSRYTFFVSCRYKAVYFRAELIADIHFLLAADTRRYISGGGDL